MVKYNIINNIYKLKQNNMLIYYFGLIKRVNVHFYDKLMIREV